MIFLKWSEVVINKTNKVFQKSFKIVNFGSNETFSFGPFWGPICCQKIKNIAKNQNFCQSYLQTYILRNIKKLKSQVPIKPVKSFYPSKIKQYIYMRGRSNCPLVPFLKVIIHSHLAYNATFHPDAKFQLLVICCSRLYLKETIKFFWFRTQFGPFLRVWRQLL